jgi:hypothetical protein
MRNLILLLFFSLKFLTEISAQNRLLYDPEPIKYCLVCPYKHTPIRPFRLLYKTEIEYIKSLQQYEFHIKENERIDKEYPDCENRRNECLADYQKKLLEWRQRNPNWRETAKNKEEIQLKNNYDIKEEIKDAIIGEKYIVTSQTLNMRSGPGTEHKVIKSLSIGDIVTLIKKYDSNWWEVAINEDRGYLYSSYLKIDPESGWEKKNYESGATPDCENVTPKYDSEIDNFLRVKVGTGTDVIIKLMKKGGYNDECIRIVYIRSGDTFEIKNVPEGQYYLKIAYGKDYRKKISDGICFVKFTKNAHYEKGIEILDFNLIKNPDRRIGDRIYESWSVPSFELFLDVIETYGADKKFKANSISEEEFNK